jgi:N-acetylneuraminic acid mutarotase
MNRNQTLEDKIGNQPIFKKPPQGLIRLFDLIFINIFLCCLLLGSNPIQAQSISFAKKQLFGTNISEPTSIDFGPDGRLYVSERTGTIYAFTVDKIGGNYNVTATETILLVKQIPNHNDDGSATPLNERQITGLLVVGTAANPILYVTSSDARIGGGGGSDTFLDTNSGIISKLTKNGSSWEKVDLIRGLPRSEENHATNGIQFDESKNVLFVAQGGNTNAGAPSANFDHLCEYALSAAILEVDLALLEGMPTMTDPSSGQKYKYDLPTLDDPTRPNDANGNDINDPFGGNDGLNQAKYVPGGPIKLFSTGYRNQYDLVLTELGHLYTWDNGPNGGIGGHPENEGAANVTNNWVPGEPGSNTPGPNDAKVNNKDGLHKVTEGYYAGHPTPVRANPLGAGLFTHENGASSTGTFRTSVTGNPATTLPVDWPPYPESLKDIREADFQNPGISDMSLYTIEASTNGMTEYTANTFNGAMKGDLLAASFSGDIFRVDLDENGNIGEGGVTSIANQMSIPLDVTSLPNNSFFAGTIWVVEYTGNKVTILEPANNNTCLGSNDNTIDEDGDGYTNEDEIQNGSDPCNPAISPADFDQTLIGGFKVSNLNDPDDDDDGLLDTVDPFAQDPFNGQNTTIPLSNRLANGASGLLDLGFTGLMTNNSTDYLDLIHNENDIIPGGAPELLVIPNVAEGTALGNINNELNAFQFGIKVDINTPSFTVSGKIVPPFLGANPAGGEQHGIYIGTGDQNNYIKILLSSNNGNNGIQLIKEDNGVFSTQFFPFPTITNAASLKLSLSVDPAAATVQPLLAIQGGTDIPLGSGPINITGSLLSAIQSVNTSLAVGISATTPVGGNAFTAIWDDINILFNDPNALTGQWETIHDGNNCAALGSAGSCPTGRHETAYVEAGNKFYLLGGRESTTVNIYDPVTKIWTEGTPAPLLFHHFQAIEYQGLIWVIGAFTGGFPNETPVPNIYIYDPKMDQWTKGAEIPVARQRGAAGAISYKGKIYLVGGIKNGHVDGIVNFLDEYDPTTNQWQILPNAPNLRDHVQAVIFDDKLYLVAGKQTNLNGNVHATEPDVDVYDFDTQTWTTLPNPIPTPRGGGSVALLGNEILAIGGESNSATSLNKTEALNLEDNTWRTLPNLNEGRHGTQAIVNNGVVYIASGSPVSGANFTLSQEVFYFTQKNVPVFTPISQSLLEIEGENLNSINTLQFVNNSNSEAVKIKNTTGNQGIIIENLTFSIGTSTSFSYVLGNGASLPFILAAGDSLTININNSSNTSSQEEGALVIKHSGINEPTTTIILNNVVCVDVDEDGVCVENDCNDNDPAFPKPQGTACDDGNPNTMNDVIQADGCTCKGITGGVADCNGILFKAGVGNITLENLLGNNAKVEIIGAGTNYMINVICDGNCNDTQVIPNLAAGSYQVKINMFGSDNSYCYREETITVLAGPCIDEDQDGVCSEEDCDDNNPAFPKPQGTACDDGNSNTVNDVIQADGCTCQGTLSGGGGANCDAVQFIGEQGQIKVENLTAAGEIIEIIGAPTNWSIVPICNLNCDETHIIPDLSPGDYLVKVNMLGNDNTFCFVEKTVTVLEGNCTDADNDGVCANEDCNDNDANFPKPAGTACDDGNPNTANDVIQADGCTCAGTLGGGGTADCDAVTFTGGNGTITLTNLNAASEIVEIIGAPTNWTPTVVCSQEDDCPNTYVINNLGAGTYFVKLQMFGNDNTYCFRQETVVVSDGACTDADNDGVCADADCDDNNALIPTTPGTTCNDGNPATINDVIQADGCTCQGQIACIVDADNDGVCADADCDDNNAAIPTTPGTACNDGNPNTTNDVIQADGCTCAGTIGGGGAANCDAVEFLGGAGQITLTNLSAQNEIVQILGAKTNWEVVEVCNSDCSNPLVIPNLEAGSYIVKLQMIGNDNSYCFREETVTVIGNSVATAANRMQSVLSFAAYAQLEHVEMKWLNNTAFQNDHFVIERSADGKIFEALTQQQSKGNAHLMEHYTTMDTQPLNGDNFYRLKLIHKDGSSIYTPVQKVNFSRVSDFGIYPNPAKDEVFINLDKYLGKEVIISIKDQLGRTKFERQIAELNTANYPVLLNDFDNGLYIIQVKVGNTPFVAKKLLVSKLY